MGRGEGKVKKGEKGGERGKVGKDWGEEGGCGKRKGGERKPMHHCGASSFPKSKARHPRGLQRWSCRHFIFCSHLQFILVFTKLTAPLWFSSSILCGRGLASC